MKQGLWLLMMFGALGNGRAQVDPAAVCLNLSDPGSYTLPAGAADLANPVLFVTQMPLGADMQTRMSAFGHHGGQTRNAGRGGDLYILHPSSAQAPAGCLRNLTREAGFGEAAGFQGANAIAVREPYVHPDGTRALFSMVVGAPTDAGELGQQHYWQIYEISGLGLTDVPTITRVPGQPGEYNNVSPIYAPDAGRILFTSDLPIGGPGNRHLYPPRDEYELMPTTLGLWELDPAAGPTSLRMITHNPSGVFTPLVDSFGRVLFVSWDHLQRDIYQFGLNGRYSWNLSDESPDAVLTDNREHFPEPEISYDPDLMAFPQYGTGNTHTIKLFFLWELTGTEVGSEVIPYTNMEILNHLGRHQLTFYLEPNYLRDGNGLEYFTHPTGREQSLADGLLFPAEDPNVPGRYWFTDGQHFTKNSSGQVFYVDAPPGRSPDQILPIPVTPDDDTGVGRFRNAVPLAGGQVLAVHTPQTAATRDEGEAIGADQYRSDPNYVFRLRLLGTPDGDGIRLPGDALLPEIHRQLQVWGVQQGRLTEYDGPMSQLDPVEVVARTAASLRTHPLPGPEQAVLADRGVAEDELVEYLKQHDLALIVVRDATTRDDADRQQPFNLFVQDSPDRVSDTGDGELFPIQYLQLFQGDMIRVNTYAGVPEGGAPDTPPEDYDDGRRVLPVPMHDAVDHNPPFAASPESTVGLPSEFTRSAQKVAPDGSIAAFVPAGRALSWQLTDADGAPIVRERFWLTFQPGEIRVCGSCHGVDTVDQMGRGAPTQEPQALGALLDHWSTVLQGMVFRDGFE